MKKLIMICFSFLFFIGCNKRNEKKEYYPSGKLKSISYFENDNLIEAKIYNEKGKPLFRGFYDTNKLKVSNEYDENGNLVYLRKLKKGDYYDFFMYDKNQKITMTGSHKLIRNNYYKVGLWTDYRDNNIKITKEMYLEDTVTTLNQTKYYKNNKLVVDSSTFYEIIVFDKKRSINNKYDIGVVVYTRKYDSMLSNIDKSMLIIGDEKNPENQEYYMGIKHDYRFIYILPPITSSEKFINFRAKILFLPKTTIIDSTIEKGHFSIVGGGIPIYINKRIELLK